MDFMGPILEILKCIGPPLWKYIEYHRKLEEYQKKFKTILEQLQNQKSDLELRLRTECTHGKLPKNEVNNWLDNAQTIINYANMEHMFKKGKYLSRVHQAKLIDKKIQEVKDLCQRGSSFHSLAIEAPPPSGLSLPTTALVGESLVMGEIWRHLIGNEVTRIGVWGMGGVGKTTIVTEINNRLVKEHKFDHVIWVTVSQAFDLIKVQNEIANALNPRQSLSGSEDIKRRAGALLRMFEGKRFVLILDDMWKAIRFEELGIPEATKENGCKLVITTRSLEICQQMGCKTIKVVPLSEEDALKLFLERAKLDISKVPTLKEIVVLVLKQCGGLPLAIVTVASAMKGEEDTAEWENALSELSDNIKNIKIALDDEVFGRLKFSYDRLKNENIQHCFLYCALYPEDFNIPKNELVDCWIREGFVDEGDNLQERENRAHVIIKSLINNCLLVEITDYRGRSCIKLHDVVRDMTLKYITSESPLFMVKAGLKLEELPGDQEWKENLDKVSLMRNDIRVIPSSMSPNCKTLSTLLLQGNPFGSIPESFFSQLHGLKILNLSGTEIESLPSSVSKLTNLTTMLLKGCGQLKHVPSLAKLLSLRELELGETRLNEVPGGMEMLTNLTSLDLLSIKLRKLPAGMFPKLCHLQRLQVYWGFKTARVAVEESTRLKSLHRLMAQFRNLRDFNYCAKILNYHQYRLFLCQYDEYLLDSHDQILQLYDADKEIILRSCNICGREEVNAIFLPKDLEVLLINSCYDVRSISDIPTFNTLGRLEILHVERLENLTILLNVSESLPGQYSHLKGICIGGCSKLEKMFSSTLLWELKNLEWIEVEACHGMEELIAIDDGDGNDERSQKEFHLPKLRRLELYYTTNLKSICSCSGVMVFDSLQVIKVSFCWQMKKIISTSKLQLDALKNLEEIDVQYCDEMEDIIVLDDVDAEETTKKELIHLPKLRELTIRWIPKLKRIINNCGSTGVMVCDSLQQVTICRCPQLKRLPLHLPIDEKGQPSPPPALKIISTTREWWEALEWDHLHPQAKSILLPFVSFDE